MPTLHWIGKEKVINHHMDVPYRVLEHNYGYNNCTQSDKSANSGNKIIHGDNLEALKALLPEYEGRVKCIYIDPPYNTGNEGWVYNDNVNDPKINKWLHETVGKEGEDLSRHDKWLCMMYPRLKLLHKLLTEDGIFFCSIDENAVHYLRLLLIEIFGNGNFISQLGWQKVYSPKNQSTYFSNDYEYVVCFAKNIKYAQIGLLPRTEEMDKRYKNPDNDPRGPWKPGDLVASEIRKGGYYDVINPANGLVFQCPIGKHWSFSQENMERLISENRIYFGKDGKAFPSQKQFLTEVQQGRKASSLLSYKDYGHTDAAKKEIKSIFNEFEKIPFDTPKPLKLISNLLILGTNGNKDSIILDSFAGSGTTAHAVLNLNQQDGGNRKFILVEMEEYAQTITAERVKRVIQGYGDTAGTGGSFDYYGLGQPLFNEHSELNEAVGITAIRNYVYYTETKHPLVETKHKDNKYLLGKYDDTAYYFNYEYDGLTTLDHKFLATIKTKAEQYVIYADNCLLTKEFMLQNNIIFKKIPRDITRF